MENATTTVYVCFAWESGGGENNAKWLWGLGFFFPPPLNDYLSKYAILVIVLSQGMKNNLIPRNPI